VCCIPSKLISHRKEEVDQGFNGDISRSVYVKFTCFEVDLSTLDHAQEGVSSLIRYEDEWRYLDKDVDVTLR